MDLAWKETLPESTSFILRGDCLDAPEEHPEMLFLPLFFRCRKTEKYLNISEPGLSGRSCSGMKLFAASEERSGPEPPRSQGVEGRSRRKGPRSNVL